MAILADQHMHTDFSFDGHAKMEEMVISSINKGLKHIALTDHNDFDYPVTEECPKGCWDLNTDAYLYELLSLRSRYEEKIQIAFGIEIGMQESAFRKNAILARAHEYDFIIGSIHLVNGVDTYWPSFFEGRTLNECMDEYYRAMLKNIKQFNNFDVLGHIDYIVRTLPKEIGEYNPLNYLDYTDEIFDFLIENEKGIEINTSQIYRRGFDAPNPPLSLVKRYKERGGEIITVGSDAHYTYHVAGAFDIADSILKNAGFKYYSVFKDRIPTYVKL